MPEVDDDDDPLFGGVIPSAMKKGVVEDQIVSMRLGSESGGSFSLTSPRGYQLLPNLNAAETSAYPEPTRSSPRSRAAVIRSSSSFSACGLAITSAFHNS
jgi:hypothetical protein